MLHGGPLLKTAFMRDLGDGESGYVVDALERAMLLPTDMDGLKKMRMQEVFLNTKRHLGMVRLLNPKTLLTLTPGPSFTMYLSPLTGSPGHL